MRAAGPHMARPRCMVVRKRRRSAGPVTPDRGRWPASPTARRHPSSCPTNRATRSFASRPLRPDTGSQHAERAPASNSWLPSAHTARPRLRPPQRGGTTRPARDPTRRSLTNKNRVRVQPAPGRSDHVPSRSAPARVRGARIRICERECGGSGLRIRLRRGPEPRTRRLLRDAVQQRVAEQLGDQSVGGVHAVGVFERVEIHEEPADHGERERC